MAKKTKKFPVTYLIAQKPFFGALLKLIDLEFLIWEKLCLRRKFNKVKSFNF